MRPEIITLLQGAGVLDANTEPSWDRVVMARNRTSPVGPPLPAGSDPAEEGFHFLLVSPSGSVTHYCKCCAARRDARFHRRAEVLALLGTDPRARPHLPDTTTVRNDRIELHVAEFLDGHPLDQAMAATPGEASRSLLARALDAAADLSFAYRDARRDDSAAGERTLSGEASDLLAALDDPAVEPEVGRCLRQALAEGGVVPRIPQHGDFWPANILVGPGGTVSVLDLDRFGVVDVPLFDVLHLLRTLHDVDPTRTPGPWIERVLGEGPTGRLARSILLDEAVRWRLSPAQVGACFLYYLLRVAVRTRRRGVWTRFKDELPPAGAFLRRWGSAQSLGEALLCTPG